MVWISFFLRLSHIDPFVSRQPVYLWMASHVIWRFLSVVGRAAGCLDSFMPLYARAWVSEFSFAPCVSNSTGIDRSIQSSISFTAPSFARWSLPSLPLILSCPFTHLKVVVAVHFLKRWAAFLKRGVFFISIHPLSSHVPRCVVSPLMTYFELVSISSGWKVGVASTTVMTATNSPVWFDCSSPGTWSALFLLSASPYHIPLPLCVFSFPLLKHVPSVKIVCVECHWCILGSWWQLAGMFDILFRSVKILKHSARLFLQVIVGLNRIASLVALVVMLCSFLVLVRERFLC